MFYTRLQFFIQSLFAQAKSRTYLIFLWTLVGCAGVVHAQASADIQLPSQVKLPPETLNDPLVQWALRTGYMKLRNPPRPWPKQLDEEQKAMLTESPNLFPFKEPAERFGAFHVDERHYLQSEMKGDGWVANSEAERRVFLYDRITGTRQETPLRGALSCYSPQRAILSTGYRYFEEGGKKMRVYTTLEGPPDGSAMEAHEYPDRPSPSLDQRFNLETCMPYADRDKFFPEGTWGDVYALKPGHGFYVIRHKKQPVGLDPNTTHWITNEQGEALVKLPIVNPLIRNSRVHYVSKSQRYFLVQWPEEQGDSGKDSAKPRPVVSFGPLGQNIQLHYQPPLIRNFLDWGLFFAQHGTAIGIVYSNDANDDPNDPMVGVYIERDGRVHRLLNKPAHVYVSPDGCLLNVTYFDRRNRVRFRPRDASDYASRTYQLCTEK